MKKRIIALIMAMVMLAECGFSMNLQEVSASEIEEIIEEVVEDEKVASATESNILASGECGENLLWKLSEEGVFTVSGTGGMNDSSFEDGNRPWEDHTSEIKEVVIEDGVTDVAFFAFASCTNLVSVDLGNTVKTIHGVAFDQCTKLESIIIPSGVELICEAAFNGCSNLKEVELPNSLTEIRTEAFRNCDSLNNIILPESIETIGEGVFKDCDNLVLQVYADSYGLTYAVENSLSYEIIDTTPEILSGTCGDNATWTLNSEGVLEISGTGAIENYPSFRDHKDQVTKLIINEGITEIGESAFQDFSNLSGTLVLPESLTSIHSQAFYNCDGITGELILPERLTYIGGNAFASCNGLSGDLVIPDSVTEIVSQAFYGCTGLDGTLILSENLEIIGQRAFGTCLNLTGDIVIPKSVAKLDVGHTFDQCENIHSIAFANPECVIGDDYYSTTYHLEEIMPTSVIVKGYYDSTAYEYAKKFNRTFNEYIVEESGACGDDTNWVLSTDGTLTINGTGEIMGNREFIKFAHRIEKIIIEDGITGIWANVFEGIDLSSDLVIPEGVTFIDEYAFYGARLSGITLPESLKEIGSYAFANTTIQSKLVIPNSITTIRSHVFDCAEIADIQLSSNLTTIEEFAFIGSSPYKKQISITLPDGLTYIGVCAFENCGFEITELPPSLENVDCAAFNWSNLSGDIILPDGFNFGTGYGGYGNEFSASLITSITLPNSVTYIPNSSFAECKNLSGTVIIPENVEEICNDAFKGTTSLEKVVVLNPECYIADSADVFAENTILCGSANSTIYEYAVTHNRTFEEYCDHDWNTEYTIDVEATCTSDGSKSIHCKNCNSTKDDTVIEATGHQWNNGEITQEPTTEAEGIKTYTCTVCSATKTESIEKIDNENPIVHMDTLSIDTTDAKVGDVITVSVKITDNVSLERVQISFDNTDNLQSLPSRSMIYNSETDRYELQIEVTKNFVGGHWQVNLISAYDKASNYGYAFYKGNSAQGNGEFYVTNPNVDSEAPSLDINSFEISNDVAVLNEEVSFRIKVSDNVGVSYVTFSLNNLSTSTNKYLNAYLNEETGYYEYIYKFKEESDIGHWYVDWICAYDQQNNRHMIDYNYNDETTKWIRVSSDETGFDYDCEVVNLTIPSGKASEISAFYKSSTGLYVRTFGNSYVDTIKRGYNYNTTQPENGFSYILYYNLLPFESGNTIVELYNYQGTIHKVYNVTVVPDEYTCHVDDKLEVSIYSLKDQTYSAYVGDEQIEMELLSKISSSSYDKTRYQYKYNISFSEIGKHEVIFKADTDQKDIFANISVIDHTWNDTPTVDVEPTCSKEGTQSIHCSGCDARKDSAPVDTLEHSYGQWIVNTKPTYTKKGVERRDCNNCDAFETKDIPFVEITEMYFSTSTNAILLGESYNTNLMVFPNTPASDEVIWKSSDESIATVEKGIVYSKETGRVEISATVGQKTISKTLFIGNGIECGFAGTTAAWFLDENGVLTFVGSGDVGIGQHTFSNPTKKIVFEDGITSIRDYAFTYTTGLHGSLELPNTLIYIGDFAFPGDGGLTGELILPEGLTHIGRQAFSSCSGFTGDLILPESLTSIGMCAFSQCSGFDGKLKLSSNLKTISNSAFENCSGLTGDLEIPEGIEKIEDLAFRYCYGLNGNLILPDTLTTIGTGAFYECRFIKEVTLPDDLQYIGKSAFEMCYNLSGEIIIPKYVTYIGEYAFSSCYDAEGITIMNPECEIYDDQWTLNPDVPICGLANSTAQKYAEKYDRTFILYCDHQWETELRVDLEPTCEKDGSKSIHCSLCGSSKKNTSETIPSTGHDWDDGAILVEPTFTDYGKMEQVCGNCGDIKEVPIVPKTIPGIPTLVKVASYSYNKIKITWETSENAEGYMIYRKLPDAKSWTKIKELAGEHITSYIDATAATGTTYFYTVRAYYTKDGVKKASNYDKVGLSAKAVPNKSTITSLDNQMPGDIKISWKKISGANGYRIYRVNDDGSYTTVKQITSGSTLTYTETGLTVGETYRYRIRAYRTVDDKPVFGAYSSIVPVTCDACAIPIPQLVKAASYSYNKIKVTWNPVDGVDGYRVYRKTEGGSWKSLKVIYDGTTSSYIDTAASTGTTYIYTVKAFHRDAVKPWWSGYEEEGVSAKAVPNKVKISSISNASAGKLKITWEKVSGASGYRIYRITDEGTYVKIKQISSGTTVTYTHTGLQKGDRYQYRIRAYRTVNGSPVFGPYSTAKTATVK